MSQLVIANEKLLQGTYATGTSPENLLLNDKIGNLTQVFSGALDTFYIDNVIGAYKTVADSELAAYYVKRKTGVNAWANSIPPEADQAGLTPYFWEVHLSLGTAQPFKLGIAIMPGQDVLNLTQSKKLIIECTTSGEIQYYVEEFNRDIQGMINSTPPRKLGLSWLGTPYLFMIRAFIVPGAVCFEINDEFGYLTDTPRVSDFFSEEMLQPNLVDSNLALLHYSRTAGDTPAFVSVGWGYMIQTQNNPTITPQNKLGNDWRANGNVTGAGGWSLVNLAVPETLQVDGVNIQPVEVDVWASGEGFIAAHVHNSQGFNPPHGQYVSESGKEKTVPYRSPGWTLHVPPGGRYRWQIKFREVKNAR